VAHRAGWLTGLALALGALHQTVVVLAATALAAGVLAWRGRARWAPLLLAVPTGMLANNALKHLFGRPRPVLDDPLLRLATLSFPSGHAIAAILFYGALLLVLLAHERRRPVRLAAAAFALAMIVLVAFSRVYLGVHYFSDVLAGVCFGVAWLALWLEGLERWERRSPR
jgi:undecaprenyl-diphosphatase